MKILRLITASLQALFLQFTATAAPLNHDRVKLIAPGTLEQTLIDRGSTRIDSLTVEGPINSADIKFMNAKEGMSMNMVYLDISRVSLVKSDVPYYTLVQGPPGGMGTTRITEIVLSNENYVEKLPSHDPTKVYYRRYADDLAYAFRNKTNFQEVHLPEGISGVGNGMFYKDRLDDNLKKVVIPASVRYIGDQAFTNNLQLNTTIPADVDSIGFWAFGQSGLQGTLDLTNATIIAESAFLSCPITAVRFGSRLKSIGNGAFSGTMLSGTLEIPGSVEEIGKSAFSGCEGKPQYYEHEHIKSDGLTRVIIKDGVKRLGENAFARCSNLAEVTVPADIIDIGAGCFAGTPFDDALPVEDNVVYLGSVAYRLGSKFSGTSLTLREGTRGVAGGFSYNGWEATLKALTSLTLPSTLEHIGDTSFKDLYEITEIVLPDGVRHIGKNAFEYCPKLRDINFPEQLTYIGASAFDRCESLSVITIPAGVTFIGSYAFSGCNAVVQLNYNAVNALTDKNNCPLDGMKGLRTINIGNGVRRIPPRLFSGRPITEIALPTALEYIDFGAFDGCKDLAAITLPETLKEIGDWAFSGCEKLNIPHFPKGLRHIGEYAFSGCSLENIALPESIESIGCYAFDFPQNLKRVFIPAHLRLLTPDAIPLDEKAVYTCAASEPPAFDGELKSKPWGQGVLRVPTEAVEAYRAHEVWGKIGIILPFGDLWAQSTASTTTFSEQLTVEASLRDTIVGQVYISGAPTDVYNAAEGCIELRSTMQPDAAEAVGGMLPGRTDLAYRFNGLVVNVHTGTGYIKIDCATSVNRAVAVKVGKEKPTVYTQPERGVLKVDYDVSEPTCIYIYGVDTAPASVSASIASLASAASEGATKFFVVNFTPVTVGIDNAVAPDSAASVTAYFTLGGQRIDRPTAPGIYILRRADGSNEKVLVK